MMLGAGAGCVHRFGISSATWVRRFAAARLPSVAATATLVLECPRLLGVLSFKRLHLLAVLPL